VEVTIAGLTIAHGFDNRGGGISNLGTLTVIGCALSDNVSNRGGAIANLATLSVIDSTFTNNAGKGANGLGVGGGAYNLGTLLFDADTVIAHNHASNSNDDRFGC
jgi:hypothetical protein